MKINQLLFTLATTTLVWVTGCDKKDASLQDQAKSAANEAGAAVKETSEEIVKDVKEASQKVAQDVTDKAKEVAAPINAKAQEIIDSAKKMVADGKIQDALDKWKELAGEKLSAEQQAMAVSLKAQIDNLVGTRNRASKMAAKTNVLSE